MGIPRTCGMTLKAAKKESCRILAIASILGRHLDLGTDLTLPCSRSVILRIQRTVIAYLYSKPCSSSCSILPTTTVSLCEHTIQRGRIHVSSAILGLLSSQRWSSHIHLSWSSLERGDEVQLQLRRACHFHHARGHGHASKGQHSGVYPQSAEFFQVQSRDRHAR